MDDRWTIDPELGESLQPHEREIAAKIAAYAAGNVCSAFTANGEAASRDVHVRAHGCVAAEFIVAASLLPEFAQGVFIPGHRYAAWIRFSSSTGDPKQSDAHPDVHAMAIKLLGVSGASGPNGAPCVTTQDFILLNSPRFPACDAADYLKFIRRGSSANRLVRTLAPLALGLRGALIGLTMKGSPITNPLTIRYWSTVPYRLGDAPYKAAVKYATIPRTPAVPTTLRRGRSFLRDAMIATLRSTDVTFDFAVQRRTSAALSVEDPRREWSEANAPLYTVATIVIPQQTFATDEREAFAENLAFNPWHALPQHRPLGSVNRTRRVVYEITADLRRRLNGVALEEPMPNAPPDASGVPVRLGATGSPQSPAHR